MKKATKQDIINWIKYATAVELKLPSEQSIAYMDAMAETGAMISMINTFVEALNSDRSQENFVISTVALMSTCFDSGRDFEARQLPTSFAPPSTTVQ